ncbi:MAG TPA: tetratricopeptide repeat protein [Candidatus Limnocylindrales bacterium]|nr:tetratricopeptide repeat protein [Candidatus Limnocylindrales bacterium]
MTALRLPRPRPFRPLAILGASLVLVAASQAVNLLRPAAPATPARPAAPAAAQPPTVSGPVTAPEAPVTGAPADLLTIDHSITAWTANLAANDRDFISAANLGLLYEARARLSGDVSDYGRATEAATRSLAIEPRQLDVQALHARLLFATHDFAGALREAQALDAKAPNQPAVLSIMADATLELGDVDGAASIYDRVAAAAPGPAITARQARIAFLHGDTADAVARAEAAYAAAGDAGETGPSLSWYAYLAGTMAITTGVPDDAATWFDKALDAWPGSYLALAGRARAAAALGDTDRAIAGYRAAIAVAPQPDALTALGDLLSMRGDTAGADAQYATVLAIAKLQGAGGGLVYNRQLVLFDVNHGRDLATALTLAEQELAVRKDAYGYDADAWALLANGRTAEADAAITTALAGGVRDALLLYHAGEIKLALGDREAARTFLSEALAIRGALDPLAASRAQASLDMLGDAR